MLDNEYEILARKLAPLKEHVLGLPNYINCERAKLTLVKARIKVE